eukprot:gnl/MRDRNA2_/MRDRNA2_33402_c0_seq2.p1 gnl/MRDRNA2_/MRDRNA2_33402_c0~~gnl/MRDRNA2_/MRDRNA2_33402_c0_seq2.p1  ORF type:complete len:367 (-),score=22.28 gnl/MRDRNA2_/MRDRNA2_33402_c0_seq2:92-1192(-)
MWAVCAGHIAPGVVQMSLFYFLAGQGCIFTYMPGLLNYKNTPKRFHGISLGFLDMSFGLSSVLFSQIYSQVFGKNSNAAEQDLTGFLLFLGICMIGVNAVNCIILHIPSHRSKIKVSQSVDLRSAFSSSEVSGCRLFRSFEFWLVFLFFLLNQGSCLWFIGAISDMVTSFGLPNSEGAMLVTLLTATGTVCRISAGMLSDLLHPCISRAGILFLVSTFSIFGFALLAVTAESMLTIGAMLVGASFGCSWCLVPLLVSDIFGIQNFSTNWGVIILGSGLGPFILQPIDTQVQHLAMSSGAHSKSATGHCLGFACYQNTYIVCIGISVICSTLILVLARRVHKGSRTVNLADGDCVQGSLGLRAYPEV